MKILTHEVPESWRLIDIGDLHIGSMLFHRDAFLEARERILEDKNAYVVFGGDLIEAITVDDKRMQLDLTDTENALPLQQCREAVDLLKPLAKRIIVSLDGNHEYKLHRMGSLGQLMSDALGVPFGTYSAKINYKDKHGLQFKHYTTHGYKTIRSHADDPIRREANEKLVLKRHLSHICADAYLMTKHHIHKLILAEPENTLYMCDNGNKHKKGYTKAKQNDKYIPVDLRWYGTPGSFMKLYGPDGTSGYAERFEMPPVEIGYLKFHIEDRTLVRGEKIIL